MGALYDTRGKIIVPQHSITDLYDQDVEFVRSILEDRDPDITGEDVLPAMKILQQAQSLAETTCPAP